MSTPTFITSPHHVPPPQTSPPQFLQSLFTLLRPRAGLASDKLEAALAEFAGLAAV